MTDRYAGVRAALDAEPKPGKWTWKQVGSFNTPGCAIFWPDSSKGGVHYRRLDSGGGMEQMDADYIAAANPETIRTLLADYDRMRDALVAVVHQLDGRRASRSDDDAPGHSHQVSGIWDSDNGDLAGKPCAWCALWREVKALVQEQGGSDASL